MLHHPWLAQKSQWGEIESRDSSCVFCFLRRCEYTVTCCWGHTVSLTHSLRTTWTWDNSSSLELYYWMFERVFAPTCGLAHGNSGTDGNSWELTWGHTWEPEVLSERTHHYRTSHNTRTRGVKGSVAGQAAPKSRTWSQPHPQLWWMGTIVSCPMTHGNERTTTVSWGQQGKYADKKVLPMVAAVGVMWRTVLWNLTMYP